MLQLFRTLVLYRLKNPSKLTVDPISLLAGYLCVYSNGFLIFMPKNKYLLRWLFFSEGTKLSIK